MVDYISEVGGEVAENDARKSTADIDALISGYLTYFTTTGEALYSALHVTGSTKSKVFEPNNDNVRMALLLE